METPEKIYVHVKGDRVTNTWNSTWIGVHDVEYIRKDAFIEKATEWLCHNYDKYIRIIGSSVYPAYAELCKDFQKAMKGE